MNSVELTQTKPRRIGILGFDGINGLDLTGPLEAFAHASMIAADGEPRPYETLVLGLGGGSFVSESGLRVTADFLADDAPALDTVIVPGGSGLRRPAVNALAAAWLSAHAPGLRRVATVCTGIYGLAPTGQLDGRRVATHWRFTADVARRFPALKVDADALFIKDGPYYTSAGVTAGIDLALALIEEDLGPHTALDVARELVVYLVRPGGQQQYSEPLRLQTRAADRFGDIVAWILAHPEGDHSVEALAARACLSPRHFSRRFTEALGRSPASFVEEVRMHEACQRLTQGTAAIDSLAASLGFRSSDVFRRVFERRFGIAPSSYRDRFGARRQPAPLSTQRTSP